MRLLAALAVVAAGLVAIGVVASVGPPADAEPLPPAPAVDLIALVTADGRIATIAPDGSDGRLITPDDGGYYTWPTWSPDASSIVYSAVARDPAGGARISLVESDLGTGTARTVHEGPRGPVVQLAEGIVHYPIWSPDGRHLAFIAAGQERLELWIDRQDDGEGPQRVLGNGPLWLSWSADSRRLLAHRAREVIVIDLEGPGGYQTTTIDSLAERFRVGAWSPEDGRFAYVERDGGGDHVIVIAEPGGARTRVSRAPVVQSALSWSPDGRFLAVHGIEGLISYGGQQLTLGRGFRLHAADGEPTDRGVGDLMVAMFWSPDGSRIAYVTAPDPQGRLSWHLYDVESNESWALADFIPSGAQAALLSFFDQYALSHSPWSADGTRLVFAGRLWSGVVSASIDPASMVISLPVEAPAEAARLAEGVMAFPSPR